MTKNITEIIIPNSEENIAVLDVTADDVDCILEAQEAERIADYEPDGRDTKLTESFLEAARIVLNDDINAIIFTDEELVQLINMRLPEPQRIDKRTFQRWKAKSKEGVEPGDAIGEQFKHILTQALILQKQHLFQRLRWDFDTWQRWAWIIERKFDEWNIRIKQEVTGANGGPITTKAEPDLKDYSKADLHKLLEKMPE